jgi:hypothetical protein
MPAGPGVDDVKPDVRPLGRHEAEHLRQDRVPPVPGEGPVVVLGPPDVNVAQPGLGTPGQAVPRPPVSMPRSAVLSGRPARENQQELVTDRAASLRSVGLELAVVSYWLAPFGPQAGRSSSRGTTGHGLGLRGVRDQAAELNDSARECRIPAGRRTRGSPARACCGPGC